jgi:hypothetical protein
MKSTTSSNESSALLNNKGTSAETQRLQILAHLKRTPSINTLEFRELGFISPAPRILELKERGYRIESIRETVVTPDGREHRGIARYYLLPANDFQMEEAA